MNIYIKQDRFPSIGNRFAVAKGEVVLGKHGFEVWD